MHTDFLFEMMKAAKDARVRGSGRITYTNRQKALAVLFAEESYKKGFTTDDVAHLLSMHKATLIGWVENWDTIPVEALDVASEEHAACSCFCCRQRASLDDSLDDSLGDEPTEHVSRETLKVV